MSVWSSLTLHHVLSQVATNHNDVIQLDNAAQATSKDSPKSYYIKSWENIYGHQSLHIFYNYSAHTFWAILQGHTGLEIIPSTKDGFEMINVPLLDCKMMKNKLTSQQSPFVSPSSVIQFFRNELKYPIIKQASNGYTIQLNCSGLLGGGAKVSRVGLIEVVEQKKIPKDSEAFIQVQEFLQDRYNLKASKKQGTKDEQLIEKLAERICQVTSFDQAFQVEKHLNEFIDVYEEDYFDEIVLEILGKSVEEGKPQLEDYTRNFSSQTLCIELLRKGYYASERAKGGINQLIIEKMLIKITEETKSLMMKLGQKTGEDDKNEQQTVCFERVFGMLEMKEKVAALLKPLSNIKVKKVLNHFKETLNLTTEDQQEIIDEFCSSTSSEKIYEEVTTKLLVASRTFHLNTMLSPANSCPASPVKKEAIFPETPGKTLTESSPLKSPSKNQDSKATDSKPPVKIPYLNRVRLNVLCELNLLDHELGTLVELHNLLKLDIANNANNNTNSDDKKPSRSSKNSQLDDITSLIMGIVRGYRENEADLEAHELASLLPLAFIQDPKIFRGFLQVFLGDLKNDILFDAKKVRMLSFILISAMRNQDFKEYLQVDDLIQCFKILKPKIEDLSISSENVNMQEAITALNDILFLMGFIGAKGVKGDYLATVKELTKYMQTHGLEKTFNILSGKSKDPSLDFKREYALEAFKRIEGTSFEEWEGNFKKILEVGEIAVKIGKGVFLSDLASMSEALLQIKDLMVQAYLNRPKTWYDDVNNLRFLAHERVEKIIKELFELKQGCNKKYSFFAAEFLLSVIAQPHRKLREKKLVTQALWFMANGCDYQQFKSHHYFLRSRTYKYDPDINHYVKQSLLNMTQKADVDFSMFVRKFVESPFSVTAILNNKIEITAPTKQNDKPINEKSSGKKLYLKLLQEKKPKLYALARIQERSEKALDKPSILVDFKGIDKEKDCDESYLKKIQELVDNIQSTNPYSGIQIFRSLDPKTATKKSFYEAVDKLTSEKGEFMQEHLKGAKKNIMDIIKQKAAEVTRANTGDLLDVLEEFLANPAKNVLLIQGDAGAGKTLLLRLFEQKLWKKYNMLFKADSKNRNRLPLRIALSEVRSYDKAVEEFLYQHGCDEEAVREIKKEPAAILFDGYDEINQYINLYNLNKLEMWRDVKVIFTSRKENLTSLKEEYLLCFTPGTDKSKVLSYSIQPVDEAQIRKYFKAQINENQTKIEKLQEKMKTITGSNTGAISFVQTIEADVAYLEKFPDSEQFEGLCEVENRLDDHLPDIQDAQKDIESLQENNLEILPLAETVQKRLEELKKITDPSVLESTVKNIKLDVLPDIKSLEEKLEACLKSLESEIPPHNQSNNDFKSRIKRLKKVTNLTKFSKLAHAIPLLFEKNINEVIKNLDRAGNINNVITNVQKLEKAANPEYLNKVNIPEKIQEIRDFEKSVKEVIDVEGKEKMVFVNTSNAEALMTKIQEFSGYDKLKIAYEKILQILEECKNCEKEAILLIKGEYIEQQPNQSQAQVALKPFDSEKLEEYTTKIKESIPKIKELAAELKSVEFGNGNLTYYEQVFYDIHNALYTKRDKKIDHDKLDYPKKTQALFANIEAITSHLSMFIRTPDRVHELLYMMNTPVETFNVILHQTKAYRILKELNKKVDDVHKSVIMIKGDEANNGSSSEIVQTLQKQITNLKATSITEAKHRIIQKLDEILHDIKAVENEAKAIKDTVSDDAVMMKAIHKQIDDLKKFTDLDNLESIIQKFKDIITSPFMLRMLLQTLLKYPKSTANRAELYRLFANIHFEREKEKILQTEKVPSKFNVIDSFYQYSKDLAVNMFIRKVTSLQAKSNGHKVLGIVETLKQNYWHRFFDESDIIAKLSKRGAQIIEDDGVVRFVHKSILEYFAARQFADEIIDYNPDEQEEGYDPCLNKGPIIDNETAVYHFMKNISSTEVMKKKNDLNLFDKKLLDNLNSLNLQKVFGNELSKNYLYPNIFLVILLRKNLAKKISSLSDDSAASLAINNILKWIFTNPSEGARKFCEMLTKVRWSDAEAYSNLNHLVKIYYHNASKQQSKDCFKDRFITGKKTDRIKVKLLPAFNGNKTYTVKDNTVIETSEGNPYYWTLDAKLFIHDSQDNIVTLKAENGNKYLGVNPNKDNLKDKSTGLVLIDSSTPWEARDCKWILRMNQYTKTSFEFISMTDSTKIAGTFEKPENYDVLFEDVCTTDAHLGSITTSYYCCVTCNIVNNKIICKACRDKCHKGHEIRDYGSGGGFCDCRMLGCCEIATGCTLRFPQGYKNHVMYRCTQCSKEGKNKVICLGCKKHHEKEHQTFEKVTDGDTCECDCLYSRTKVLAMGQTNDVLSFNQADNDANNQKNNGEGDDDEDDDS